MNRFCKVLAVILAMLMMVTMATACKKSDGDEFDAFLDNGSSDSGFGDDDTVGDDADTDQGDDKKDPSKDDNGKDDKNPSKDDDKTPQKGEANENPDANEKEQNKVVEEYDGTKK